MEKSDVMYYTAYILLLILVGIWLLLWAIGTVELTEMFLLWLFSAGVLMMVFGTVRTREAPRGSTVLIGGGMLLSILMLMSLAIVTDIIGGWVGAAIGIILIGVAGLIILLLSMRK